MLAGGISPVRADVTHGQGFTEVVFRRSDRWKSVARLLLFVPVWLLAGLFALALLAASGDRPSIVPTWLALWGLAGIALLAILLWGALGVESLVARADTLSLVRRFLLFSKTTALPARDISDMRWLADDPAQRVRFNGRRIPQTAFEVVAGSRRLACARGIGEAEAQTTIAALRQRLVTRWERR